MLSRTITLRLAPSAPSPLALPPHPPSRPPASSNPTRTRPKTRTRMLTPTPTSRRCSSPSPSTSRLATPATRSRSPCQGTADYIPVSSTISNESFSVIIAPKPEFKPEHKPAPTAPQFSFEGLALSTQFPPTPPPRRRRLPIQQLYASYEHGSDRDADGESDGDASEDEYVPSPSLAPKKRQRTYDIEHYSRSYTPSASSRAASLGADYARARPAKRTRPAPQSRNVQTAALHVAPRASDPWACPHCPWVQHNKRTPDLKRHIRTHTRHAKPEQWVCCGVPLAQAAAFEVPPDAAHMEHRGQVMVGGCGKTFSRRDALKRHLDNDNIQCAGDLNAFPLCA